VNAEAEFGFEMGAFNGLTCRRRTRARTPATRSSRGIRERRGFREQWTNAGTLRNEIVEVSLGFPVFATQRRQ
jgi:hypothetical protein